MKRSSALLLIAALIAAGCGGRSFDAAEFVEEANGNGAMLTLGEELASSQEGKTLHEVTLGPGPKGAEASGTLTVYDDEGEADTGLEECEAATSLLCFQAANVILYFEGEQPGPAQLRLAEAMRKMADS